MKRFMLFVSLIIASITLAGCSADDYENLLTTNEELENKVATLQEGTTTLLEEQAKMATLLEEIQTQLDNQDAKMVSDLAVLVEEFNALDTSTTQDSDEMMVSMNKINKEIVKIQLDLYLDYNGYSDEYVSYFTSKIDELFVDGMTKDEFIASFLSEYSVSGVTAVNEDLSTTSTVTVNKPVQSDYEEINVTIVYHDEVLKTLTLTSTDDFTFDFEAPNYGLYTLNTEIVYEDLTIVESYDFGVTSSHYNMAFLNATLPVLMYTADHMTTEAESPTFIRIVRLSTFNWEKLPANTYEFPTFIPTGTVITDGIDGLTNWIYELYQADNTSTFELNIVDNYTGIAILAFDRYEIPEENYTVNIWTDGSFTEGALNSYPNAQLLSDRIDYITEYREDSIGLAAEDITYEYVNEDVRQYALAYAASLDNVNYYVTGLEGVTVTDETVLATIAEKVTVITVAELFDNLKTSGNMDAFEYLLNTKWGENPEDSIASIFDSPKGKYLLILGTSTSGENTTLANKYFTFDEYLQQVIDLFGDEYQIFYKGHPAYASSTERQQLFVDNDIVELEKTIPVEVLMYIYPNVYIGGYSGSSFYSSQDGQTLFFYGPQDYVDNRTTLADMMVNGIFDNTVYLYDETVE